MPRLLIVKVPAVGVADQDEPLGTDALPNRFQVGGVAADRVAPGVVQACRAADADLVVDPDVEAVAGQLPEVGRVPGHVGHPGSTVQEDDRVGLPWADGRDLHVGDARAGGQLPERLAAHRPGRDGRIVQGEQRENQAGHHQQCAGRRHASADNTSSLAAHSAGRKDHPTSGDRNERHQPHAQEDRRRGGCDRRAEQGGQPGERAHDHRQQHQRPAADTAEPVHLEHLTP
jgi:hypothetical protein